MSKKGSEKAKAKEQTTEKKSHGGNVSDDDDKYGCGMFTGENKRHWLMALLLQVGLRLRYLLDSALLFTPLFGSALTAYKSPFRPKNCPEYDYITHMGFKWITILTAFSREYGIVYIIWCYTGVMSLLQWLHTKLSDRLIAQFQEAGYTEADREMPIPEYDWRKGDPETFYNTFVVRPHPVVLRGFMKDKELLKQMNWDTVLGKYGDEEVFLTKKELDGYPGLLKEVENPQVYLHNSEKLFSKYPEIKEHLQYRRLAPFLHMKAGYEQLFVGKEGTGSPFHHASNYNMFYMVDGKKQWWFIDPYDTFLG
jgi:hypothetical protein